MIEPRGRATSTNTTVSQSAAVSSSSSSSLSFSKKQVSVREDSIEQLGEADKQTRALASGSIRKQVDSSLVNSANCGSISGNTISVVRSAKSRIEDIDPRVELEVKVDIEGEEEKARKEGDEGLRWKSGPEEGEKVAKSEQMRSRCIKSSSTNSTQSHSEQKFQLLQAGQEKGQRIQLSSKPRLLNEELWDFCPEVWKGEFQSGNNRLPAINREAVAAVEKQQQSQERSEENRDCLATCSEESTGASSCGRRQQHLSNKDCLNLKFINEPPPSFGEHSRILEFSEGELQEQLNKENLEVDWFASSFIKRALSFSPNSTSACIRTSLVRSFKAGKSSLQTEDTLGRTIKSLVDQFRSPSSSVGNQMNEETSSLSSTIKDEQQVATSGQISLPYKLTDNNENDQLINSNKDEIEPSKLTSPLLEPSSLTNDKNQKIHATFSYQSLIAQNRLARKQAASTRQLVSETRGGCEETSSLRGNDFVGYRVRNDQQIVDKVKGEEGEESNITRSEEESVIQEAVITNNKNNMMNTSEDCLSKNNKYSITEQESKIKKQQPPNNATASGRSSSNNARLEDRRSTYCSSVGGATSDINFDSSFSSANNCSESNNTCAMIRQYSRDFSRDKPENFGNDCRHPPGDPGADGNGDDSNQDPQIDGNNNKNKNNNRKKKNHPKIDEKYRKRENWDKNIEFLLAVIGFAVDLGNVWRFPYICYKNGGGAFLIPYTIMFILGGLPIFYLEMSLGQYFSSGCLTVWKRVCPMAKGIGYAMCVLNFFTGLYYNTIISWAVFFFVESFTNNLPWTSCNNSWNSNNCRTIDQRQALKQLNSTAYAQINQQVISNQTALSNQQQQQQVYYSSPTKDYFEREVLQIHLSTGIDDLGYIRKPLAIYLAIVFICIYFAIWKGVKSTGKAVWITALLPYFVLIPLLIRGVFLEGAWLGIKYYLYPQWVKIIDVDVWVEAAKQIYFSLGPGFGTLMALSSYNKFNHNCSRDTLIAASVNYFASFISGLVIFAVLGYMATIENVDISDVATEGPGLVFQVYPEGLATMRFSSMWSVLFFIMVITLGIDSTFGGLESVITGLCDEYPRLLRAHRGVFIGFLIILIYLCSLPTTTYGGNYVIYVLESYGTSLSLLFIVLIETIIVCWLYGADRFCKNLEEMYGKMPGAYWRICWKYISPTILLIIFVAACLQELDKYHTLTNGDYTYPSWAPTVGLLMTGSSVCCIPIYALYYLKTKTSGSFTERLKIAIRPIEGEFRGDKGIYVDAFTDKIRDETNIHLDTVI